LREWLRPSDVFIARAGQPKLANDQGSLAALYFQADPAFVGYGLAPLPLEAGEMLAAPSRAALDDGTGIGAYLPDGDAGGLGGGIYAGAEQPGLPDKLVRDIRGGAGRQPRQSVGYHKV
jgi:hypothetical protein